MAYKWEKIDDNTLKQAMEEFKRSMSVYNKETGEVLKKNFGTLFSPMIEFFKDYRESTKEIAEKIDKFNLTDALTNENKQSQIGEKYSALRRGVDSDVMEDMTTSLTDYMIKQFSDAINLINYWVKYCYCLVLISSPFSL